VGVNTENYNITEMQRLLLLTKECIDNKENYDKFVNYVKNIVTDKNEIEDDYDTYCFLKNVFRPGNVVLISGPKGSGKTLLATMLAYYLGVDYKKVIANYRINIKNFEKLDRTSKIERAKNSLIIIDESYQLISSRTAMSKRNILINNILSKARKHKNLYIIITQIYSAVDKNLRRIANYVVIPNVVFRDAVLLDKPETVVVNVFESIETLEVIDFLYDFEIDVKDYHLYLYDTHEDVFEIEFDSIKNQKKKKKW